MSSSDLSCRLRFVAIPTVTCARFVTPCVHRKARFDYPITTGEVAMHTDPDTGVNTSGEI
jgi:hypothetical protein